MLNNISLCKKYKYIILYLFTCIVFLLAACQATPENNIIVNKGDSELEEKVLETADPGEGWTEKEVRIVWNEKKTVDTELGKCTINLSINVDRPEYPGPVPVYLIEPKEFSIDYLEAIVKYLMAGEIYDGTPSKQDVMTEILNTKKQINEHTVSDGRQEDINAYYEYLNVKYDNATENNDKAKFQFFINEYGQNALHVKSYLNDTTIMNFSALADEEGKCYRFFFNAIESNIIFYYLNKISSNNLEANGVDMTFEQAHSLANNTMESLFEKPFVMVHANIIDRINSLEYLWNDGEETSLGQAYVFYYSPEYDGIPSLYIDPASATTTEKTEYSKPYLREYAVIVVDDRGIVYMNYESFSNPVEKLNDDVKLMPFEEVFEIFKGAVFYHSLWGKSSEITITKIEFGMVREPVKDNQNQYMMIPAWNFIGDVKTDMLEEYGKSILVLNAIDGSIITNYSTFSAPK